LQIKNNNSDVLYVGGSTGYNVLSTVTFGDFDQTIYRFTQSDFSQIKSKETINCIAELISCANTILIEF